LERGGWSVVGRGLAGYQVDNLPEHDQQRSSGKIRGS